MRYVPPVGAIDPAAPYIDGNPSAGVKGSAVPAAAIEHPQREILAVIEAAGLEPNTEDLTQLRQAVWALIDGGVAAHEARTDNPHDVLAVQLPDLEQVVRAMVYDARYEIGQVYWFDDEQPRPGMLPCLGGVVEGISQYPRIIEYLQTPWGQARCVTQAEWDDLHVATWHTNADGSKVGWEGIGGVAKFVWDQQADTLRLPDLAGMMPEMIGHDSLGVGDADGDRVRDIVSSMTGRLWGQAADWGGAMYRTQAVADSLGSGTAGNSRYSFAFAASRVVPTGPANAPRRWGSLACVYLGRPAS